MFFLYTQTNMGMLNQIEVVKTENPLKRDGENNGSKPYEQMDDLGGPPLFLETPIYNYLKVKTCSFKMLQGL